MQTTAKNEILSSPSIMAAFMSGFDAVSRHVYLLLFPIAFDLLLWLGPRLRLSNLIHSILTQLESIPQQDLSPYGSQEEVFEMMRLTREIWGILAERLNILSAMRTYPVGIPSIMSGRLPLTSPLGTPSGIELSIGNFIPIWILLVAVGLLLGTLYFSLTAQAALTDSRTLSEALKDLPRTYLQVIWLTIFLAVLLTAIGIPFMILTSIIFLITSSAASWIMIVLAGILIWLLLPIVFSPHGIFINYLTMFHSFLNGFRLAHSNPSKTSLFILMAFVISQGMDVLWQTPPEDSWLSLVGIFGHAFISTGILAASFIYYKQAEKRLQALMQQRQAILIQQAADNHKT